MNRALGVFLLSATLASLFLVSDLNPGLAQAQTPVKGIIKQDTTWAVAGSPYVFTGAVGVAEGVTLTIDAGVTVDLGSYCLEVNGTLNVQGSSTNKVILLSDENQINRPTIDWYSIAPPISGNINIIIAYGNPTCKIENAILNNTSILGQGLYSSATLTINNCDLLKSSISSWGSTTLTDSYVTGAVKLDGASTVTGNILLSGIYVTGYLSGDKNPGTYLVSGNNITNNGGAAVNAAGSGTIKDNIIWGSDRGITQEDETVLSASIQDNLIMDNKYGFYLRDDKDDAVIEANTITGNQVGIFNPSYPLTITGNNFENNSQYNIQAGVSAASATGNWWGTTDQATISQSIYDSNDDFSLGTIVYTPFLTAAGSNPPQTPDDIMLPPLTASPTDGVTYQTVSHTDQASLAGLEIGAAAAVAVVVVLSAAVAVRMHRKKHPLLA